MKATVCGGLRLILVVGLAGCGGGTKNAVETTTQAQTQPDTITLKAYFIRDGKVGPTGRAVPPTQAVAAAAMQQLLSGPTSLDWESGSRRASPTARR